MKILYYSEGHYKLKRNYSEPKMVFSLLKRYIKEHMNIMTW